MPTLSKDPAAGDCGTHFDVLAEADHAVGIVADTADQILRDQRLWPQTREMGARALLDELARALARVAIDLHDEGSLDLPELT